jgi:hypothetical protein
MLKGKECLLAWSSAYVLQNKYILNKYFNLSFNKDNARLSKDIKNSVLMFIKNILQRLKFIYTTIGLCN